MFGFNCGELLLCSCCDNYHCLDIYIGFNCGEIKLVECLDLVQQ